MKKRRFTPSLVGAGSLVIIFAVLCLTLFTVLTLSTVQANKRLSDASIQAVSDYYAADQEAERIFAQLRSGQDSESLGVIVLQNDIFSYFIPISETQELSVQVQRTASGWQVLRWQAVSLDPSAH